MATIQEVLSRYLEWQEPRDGIGDNPLKVGCRLDSPATPTEIADAWQGHVLPEELVELWLVSQDSRLFEDVDYGQWGLHLLSPSASASRTKAEQESRPQDYRKDDVVVGEFLGDQELLVLCPSETGPRRVVAALPLDARGEWHAIGADLSEVLDAYLAHLGEKFWEADAES